MRSLTTFDGSTSDPSSGRWIPRPDIPVQPVLSWDTFVSSGDESTPSVVDNRSVIYVTAGRIAIAHALELAGIRPGDKVLVPAYHCMAMVEPVLAFGAQPVFYALRDDLTVDLDDVAAKLDGATRLLMAANYFGFPQDLLAIRRFCDEHGLVFLEDCAHSFFGSHAGQPLGTFGDFAVGSLTKFFPVRDGGCLILRAGQSGAPGPRLRSQSIGANAAALLDALEEAVAVGRLRALGPMMDLFGRTKRVLRAVVPNAKTRRGVNPAQLRSGQRGGFDPAWMGVRATAVSRMIGQYASRSRIVESRRRNYLRFVQEFSGSRHLRPVFPNLPDGVVPYMFPLWVDDLADVFAILEDRAVPMQRFGQFLWSKMDEATCSVTRQISRHSIQLPCHQGLTEEEITALVDRVRTVVG